MNGLQSPAIIILDNDGVLVDSWDATMHLFNTIRRQLNLPDMVPEEERYCFAATLPDGIRGTLPPDFHVRALQVVAEMEPESLIPMIRRQDRALEFLRLLRRLGIRTALMTNGGGETLPLLRHLELEKYLDQIVTCDDVTRPKPHSEGLELILATQGFQPRQARFMGDSPSDSEAARAAGIPFWAFNNPALPAQRHIPDFAAAIRLVSGHGDKSGP